MAEETPPKIITFGKEVDPKTEKSYYDRIAKAKAGSVDSVKGRDVVGFEERPTNTPIIKNEKESEKFKELGEALRSQPMMSPQEAKELQDAAPAKVEEEEFDIADFLSTSDPVARILDNKKRRKEIEARLTPMKFEDLLYNDEVRQTVIIKPDEFEVIFRSITPEENLFIKEYVARKDQNTSSQAYLGELYTLCQLAAATVSLNKRDLPSHLKSDGTVDEKAFEQKLSSLRRKSGYIIADLSVQYRWFDIRVRRLIQPEDLKNG